MDWTHVTILITSFLGLLYVQRSALARGRRQGLDEAARVALQYLNVTGAHSRTGYQIVKEIEFERDKR